MCLSPLSLTTPCVFLPKAARFVKENEEDDLPRIEEDLSSAKGIGVAVLPTRTSKQAKFLKSESILFHFGGSGDYMEGLAHTRQTLYYWVTFLTNFFPLKKF